MIPPGEPEVTEAAAAAAANAYGVIKGCVHAEKKNQNEIEKILKWQKNNFFKKTNDVILSSNVMRKFTPNENGWLFILWIYMRV